MILRSIRSELAKLSWRSPLFYALVPLAILIPFGLNAGLAVAAQLNKINGSGGMDTDNAAYWVIVFSTFIMMAGAVTSYCGEFKDRTGPVLDNTIVLFGSDYWKRLIDFQVLLDEGAISPEDLDLFQYVDEPQAGWDAIRTFYGL